jgi:hypothetical protein
MTIQATSQEAYSKIIPKLPQCQYEVWFYLRNRPEGLTNAELAYYLNWPINRITPRILELRKLGYVKHYGKRQCKITGSMANTWVSVNDNPQLRFF